MKSHIEITSNHTVTSSDAVSRVDMSVSQFNYKFDRKAQNSDYPSTSD